MSFLIYSILDIICIYMRVSIYVYARIYGLNEGCTSFVFSNGSIVKKNVPPNKHLKSAKMILYADF
jgi:hypothetical protein